MPRLTPKTHIVIEGVEYKVERILGNGNLSLLHAINLTPLMISQAEFDTKFEQKKATFISPEEAQQPGFNPQLAAFCTVNFSVQAEAERAYKYVRELEELGPRPPRKLVQSTIEKVASREQDGKKPNIATVYRWAKKWLRAGRDIRGLIRKTYLRGPRVKRLVGEVYDIILQNLDEVWLTKARPTLKDVYACVITEVTRKNHDRSIHNQLPLPSYSTIRRAAKAIDPYEVDFARYGKARAERNHRIWGKGPAPERAGQRYEIDHTLLDIIVVCSFTGVVLGRPTLTLLIDKRTRMPMGFYLGFEAPSNLSVSLCLRDAIRPKRYINERYPYIRHEAIYCGIGEELIVDNGKEFLSAVLEATCLSLGMHIIKMPAGTPQYKGCVERFFGTLQRALIHKLPGTTFANVDERGDYDSVKNAQLTLEELVGLIWKWILDDYAQTFHRALDDTPANVWAADRLKFPINLPNRIEDLDPLIGGVEFRTVSTYGITLWGNQYRCETLNDLILAANGEKVEVRYDPGNLNTIQAVNPSTHQLVELISTDPTYTERLSLHVHRAVRKSANRKRRANQVDVNLAEERANLILASVASLEKKQGSKKTLGKSTARLLGVGVQGIGEAEYTGSALAALAQVKQALPTAASEQAVNSETIDLDPSLIEELAHHPIKKGMEFDD